MTVVSISSSELWRMLKHRYPFASVFVADGSYNVPTETAFDGFRSELANHLLELYGDKWHEYFDCDNFALEALALANRKHYVARREGRGTAQGVAFGQLAFLQDPADPRSGHAINVRLTPDLRLVEFEPQTRKDLTLTPEQCSSASLVYFS